MDPRGRVYYVDHNTRTTTWQRPNPEMMNNLMQWQHMRQIRSVETLANRFLFPQNSVPDNDPLGPLPEGWGESFRTGAAQVFGKRLITESEFFSWLPLSGLTR